MLNKKPGYVLKHVSSCGVTIVHRFTEHSGITEVLDQVYNFLLGVSFDPETISRGLEELAEEKAKTKDHD